jgi:hypothetical protein
MGADGAGKPAVHDLQHLVRRKVDAVFGNEKRFLCRSLSGAPMA